MPKCHFAQYTCRFVNDVLHTRESEKDLFRRAPVERAHGKAIVLTLPDGELFLKVRKRIGAVRGVEFFVVLTVAALVLAIVPRSKWADELVCDAEIQKSFLKEGLFSGG